ncbi:MAG: AmmeMemoRadiSam system protein A [Candidatus Firestonebacteria bacterium]
MLTKEEGLILLNVARQTLELYLSSGKSPKFDFDNAIFKEKYGAFVTLHNKNGELRGCIGQIEGIQPLLNTVVEMAKSSATEDPRFSSLSFEELKDISIEISVLSPLKKIENVDEIELGKHGVLVRKGMRSGVFLPQVATETKWSKEEFLNNLCAGKAGLPFNAWKDKDTDVYIFSAQIFSEE